MGMILTTFLLVFAFMPIARELPLAQAPVGSNGDPALPIVLQGKLERVKVHGKSLEGNLLRETTAPDVSIYLPPSYTTERNRRYPVLYLLHGYTGTDLSYFGPTGRQAH